MPRSPLHPPLRLYDQALVELEGQRGPFIVRQCADNALYFEISGFIYSASGGPIPHRARHPKILLVYSMGCKLVKRA